MYQRTAPRMALWGEQLAA